MLPSGIVLPRDKDLILREVVQGLYVAVNAYEYDAGYFGQSALYSKEQPESQSETAKPSAAEAIKSTGKEIMLLREADILAVVK